MIVSTLDHARFVFRDFLTKDWVATDTETKALARFTGKKDALVYGRMCMVVMSMCHKGASYCFLTSRTGDARLPSARDYIRLPEFQRLRRKVRFVFHNANYDWMVFEREDPSCVPFPKSWCTMIGGWVANAAQEKGLKQHAPLYGRHLHKTSTIDFSNIEELATYAEEDVILTDEVYQTQRFGFFYRLPKIIFVNEEGKHVVKKNPMPPGMVQIKESAMGDFEKRFYRLHEWPYFRTTYAAEQLGFPTNRKKLEVICKKIADEREFLLKKIYRKAGTKFNLNSGPQKLAVFRKLKISTPFLTRKGKPSLAADALVKMQMNAPHKFVSLIQRCTSVSTLARFVDPEKGLGHYISDKGRIHANANTTGAVTGRGSKSNPNLDQVPNRKDIFGIRDAFEAPKGYSMIVLDHAGLELRIMALLAREPRMADALNDPSRDLHGETAQTFSVDRDPTAKQLNFLLQFAGTAWALAEKLTVEGVPTTPQQAQVYVDVYRRERPKVIEYRESLLRDHEKLGYVILLTGRKRALPGTIRWNNPRDRHRAETTLANNTIQGSGQDVLKSGIIRCDWKRANPDKRVLDIWPDLKQSFKNYARDKMRQLDRYREKLRKTDTRFVIQVHDEAIFFVKKEAAEEVGPMIADILTWRHFLPVIVPYTVKLRVEGGCGQTWKECKSKTAPIRLDKLSDYDPI